MNGHQYFDLKAAVLARGFAPEVDWASDIQPCATADDFAREHCFVVCNSGMKAQIAVKIFDRCWGTLVRGFQIDDSVFRNRPKRSSMHAVYADRIKLFGEFQKADDRLAYLETLPYIGPVIKYHLAKNLGVPCCKPDRHLVRIAATFEMTPVEMCERLADELSEPITVVDTVIWRAANLGLI